jgi:hypothetical protein
MHPFYAHRKGHTNSESGLVGMAEGMARLDVIPNALLLETAVSFGVMRDSVECQVPRSSALESLLQHRFSRTSGDTLGPRTLDFPVPHQARLSRIRRQMEPYAEPSASLVRVKRHD